MTFKEKYLAGEIEFEAIDDYVDEWNNSDDESKGKTRRNSNNSFRRIYEKFI